MPDVTCPECGKITDLPEGFAKAANAFCAHARTDGMICDYPLFWVSTARAAVTADDGDHALRRRPGVEGRERFGSKACPNPDCQEPNDLSRTVCWRCDATLDPKPLPPFRPPAVQEAATVRVYDPSRQAEPDWVIVAVCLVALFALVALTVVYFATR